MLAVSNLVKSFIGNPSDDPPPYASNAGSSISIQDKENLSLDSQIFLSSAEKTKQAYEKAQSQKKLDQNLVDNDAVHNYKNILRSVYSLPVVERRPVTISVLSDLKGTSIAARATKDLASHTFAVGQNNPSAYLGSDFSESRRNSFVEKVGQEIIGISLHPTSNSYEMVKTLNNLRTGNPASSSRDGNPLKEMNLFGTAAIKLHLSYMDQMKSSKKRQLDSVDAEAVESYKEILKTIQYLPVEDRKDAVIMIIQNLKNTRIAGEVFMDIATNIRSLGEGKRVQDLGDEGWTDPLREEFSKATVGAMTDACRGDHTDNNQIAEALIRLISPSTNIPSNTASDRAKRIEYFGY